MSLRPVVLAALLSCGLTASAQSRKHEQHEQHDGGATSTELLQFSLGLGPAFSLGQNAPALFQLTPSVVIHLPLKAPVALYAGLVAGLQFGSGDVNGNTSLFAAHLLPTVRVAYEVYPQLRAYADVGVGMVFGSITATNFGVNSGVSGLSLRLSAGAEYWLLENVAVYLEPVGYQLQNATATSHFGNFTVNTPVNASEWTLMAGGRFRF